MKLRWHIFKREAKKTWGELDGYSWDEILFLIIMFALVTFLLRRC